LEARSADHKKYNPVYTALLVGTERVGCGLLPVLLTGVSKGRGTEEIPRLLADIDFDIEYWCVVAAASIKAVSDMSVISSNVLFTGVDCSTESFLAGIDCNSGGYCDAGSATDNVS